MFMNGLIVINKEKGYTSRDVVNIVGKCLKTKKIGHIGTLDPMATGVLVLCVGKALKLVEMLMEHDKWYVAKIKLGIETDTLDVTGEVIKEEMVPNINKNDIESVLASFVGKMKQEVPKYSAVKVNGKKLYEYARNGEEVKLPVKDIEIYDIELISDICNNIFSIKCHVSKGTYIRSLIRDIGNKLGTVAVMEDLDRISLGTFKLENSYTISDIEKGNYELLDVKDVIDLPSIIVNSDLEKKIRNGQVLRKFFEEDKVMILNESGELLAIYQKKDEDSVKPYRMFL